MELRMDAVFNRLRAGLEGAQAAREPLCAYVYDMVALRAHAKRTVAALPHQCELFYAIKANSELPVLRTLAPLVHGFEVSSGGELAWVREHFPHTPVIFSGPGKLDSELQSVLELGVDGVHLESLHEIERLGSLAARYAQPTLGQGQGQGAAAGGRVPVLLRINLALDGLTETRLMMGGKPTPFGIPAADLPAALARLRDYPQLELRGFHFHLLSHQLDADAHLKLMASYLRQVRQWCEQYRLKIGHINVGGGIGVNYREGQAQFDWDGFCGELARLMQREAMPGVKLRFELGRYMTACCGYYAMEVIDIKQSYGKTFVVGRGGTHHFRTPPAQGHSHPFHVMPVEAWPYPYARPQAHDTAVSVVGQLCTPKDVLAFDAPVVRVRCGDVLVFPLAGAYAWHISHHDFLRHQHPQQWYLHAEA
ncbi:type III PLP-dependent enzyme [Pseudoduganella sp. UC29_71]|uniref:type III PLP-dependent enzyme n=1 Tax=Pseudoduganella sp. UC29_71 TaxID=3350174 RepID=UPI00366D7D56